MIDPLAYRVTSENIYFPNFSTQCGSTDITPPFPPPSTLPPPPPPPKKRKKKGKCGKTSVVGNEFKSILFAKNILKKIARKIFQRNILFTGKTFFVKNFSLKNIKLLG